MILMEYMDKITWRSEHRTFNGEPYLIDRSTTQGVSKTEAEKKKQEWNLLGYRTRSVQNSSGKYIVYYQDLKSFI